MKRTIKILMSAAVLLLAACGKRAEVTTIWPSPPSPTKTMTPAVDLTNPIDTDEDKMLKAQKRGWLLLDENGVEFVRIHRQDNEPVGIGLSPSNVAIETKFQPLVTRVGDKWEIVFENVVPSQK